MKNILLIFIVLFVFCNISFAQVQYPVTHNRIYINRPTTFLRSISYPKQIQTRYSGRYYSKLPPIAPEIHYLRSHFRKIYPYALNERGIMLSRHPSTYTFARNTRGQILLDPRHYYYSLPRYGLNYRGCSLLLSRDMSRHSR